MVTPRYKPAEPFYDREALEERGRSLQKEKSSLLRAERDLRERLGTAERSHAELRAAKCQILAAKELDDASRSRPPGKPPASSRAGKAAEGHGGKSHVAADEFAVQDRLMELELLNSELQKAQPGLERDVRAREVEVQKGKEDVARARRRLKAMPWRFTQSLAEARLEVEGLLQEKCLLEEEGRQRRSEADRRVQEAAEQLSRLRNELEALLDEVDEADDDRGAWAQRLQVQRAQGEALAGQRDALLHRLVDEHGADAVGRAAFVLAARGAGAVAVAEVAPAMQPFFGPMLEVTQELVEEAVARSVAYAEAEGGDVEVEALEHHAFCAVVNELQGCGQGRAGAAPQEQGPSAVSVG